MGVSSVYSHLAWIAFGLQLSFLQCRWHPPTTQPVRPAFRDLAQLPGWKAAESERLTKIDLPIGKQSSGLISNLASRDRLFHCNVSELYGAAMAYGHNHMPKLFWVHTARGNAVSGHLLMKHAEWYEPKTQVCLAQYAAHIVQAEMVKQRLNAPSVACSAALGQLCLWSPSWLACTSKSPFNTKACTKHMQARCQVVWEQQRNQRSIGKLWGHSLTCQ